MINYDNDRIYGPDVSKEIGLVAREPKTVNPLLNNKFLFRVVKLPETNYKCTGVVIPEKTLPVAEQKTPFNNLKIPGAKITFQPLTIEFVVDEFCNNWREISDWMTFLGEPVDPNYKILQIQQLDFKKAGAGAWSDGVVTMLDSQGNQSIDFRFHDMFPIRLSGWTLSIDVTNVKPVTCTVDFEYSWFDMKPVV
jgi:hypothetical protein